jgi:FMN phosphatase YigB (HAD superfamily)
LPAAVLAADGHARDEELEHRATAAYRRLRQHVIDSGGELEAQECVEHVFSEIGHPVRSAQIAAIIDQLMRACVDHATPVSGVIDTISAIMARKIPVGVVSSAVYHPFLEWTLDQFGLLEQLAFVVTSASSGHYKSTPRIYTDAYAQVGADLRLGVHVGDSPRWDVTTAKAAGLAGVLFAPPPEPRLPGSDDAGPDLVLHSFEGADDALLQLLADRRNGASLA